MELKEFLLKGGYLEYPYVDTDDSWVSTAKIHCYADEVIVEVPTENGRKNFDLKEVDKAIDFYLGLIVNEKNKCSKWKLKNK